MWIYKFNLYTKNYNFELYAQNQRERDLWVETFCKAIENKHKSEPVNMLGDSKLFELTKNRWEEAKDRCSVSMLRRSIDVIVDGMEEFKSANMYVNCNQIEGYLMKKINNKKMYHT